MPPEKPDIDINRREFIKGSLVFVGAFFLGKVSGLLPLTSKTVLPASATEEYRNDRYGFSLLHPSYMKISTIDEGGGASTITFQNPEKGEGFQIFVVPHEMAQTGEVPYAESHVGEQRFNQDVPSGVRDNLAHVAVDGSTGASFYSTHTALGDTREVWIAHGGFLYELTTLKPLDNWLNTIIPTLRFV